MAKCKRSPEGTKNGKLKEQINRWALHNDYIGQFTGGLESLF